MLFSQLSKSPRFWVALASLVVVFVLSEKAPQAATDFSTLNQVAVDALVQTGALEFDFRPMVSAYPLGSMVGVDLGLDTTFVGRPKAFVDAMTSVSGNSNVSIPPLPRLNLHKGLPWGIDVGFSYMGYQGNSVTGFDLKWALLSGSIVSPALALRASYNSLVSPLVYVSARTSKFDVLVSQNITPFFSPYLGGVMQIYSGSIDVPADAIGLPIGIVGQSNGSAPHVFAGLPINLFILRLTGEYDHSFLTGGSFASKVSLAF